MADCGTPLQALDLNEFDNFFSPEKFFKNSPDASPLAHDGYIIRQTWGKGQFCPASIRVGVEKNL